MIQSVDVKVLELNPDLILPERYNEMSKIFPEIYHNVHRIGLNTLALVNVKREMK